MLAGPVIFDSVSDVNVVLRPSEWAGKKGESESARSAGRGGCPPSTVTYSDVDLSGGLATVPLPHGIVEGEIAAASYTVPADDFPLVINLMEMVFAQNHFNSTTTEWSVLVWEGTPQTGSLIAEFSSDGAVLPHVQLPAGTAQAVNLSLAVDPGDPEQIIINNNGGSNTISVGFRVDAHNHPPTSSCDCLAGLGTLPAECCPVDTNSNAFPAMDSSGPDFGFQNWLWTRDCPGGTPLCFEGPGWLQLFEIPAPFVNDWALRVTYVPLSCPGVGACCFSDGTCLADDEASCIASGGSFQGEGTSCSPNDCPQPTGACCNVDGTCSDGSLQADCESGGGVYQGHGTDCAGVSCPEPVGACCDFVNEECVPDLTEAICLAAEGVYQGHGTDCAEVDCTIPTGACCLGTGCLDGLDQAACEALPGGGIYAGDDTLCANGVCDSGACCLGPNCVPGQSQANCDSVLGEWQGPLSECAPDPCCAGLADLDCDGDADLTDYEIFYNCLGGPGVTTPPPGCTDPSPADYDDDGDVDLEDHQVFEIEYAAGQ
ncbi:MAG: hypothetical protein ACYS7M_00015 [Planctomycetota bacterium]|jgi:hypothetical protein